VRLSYLVLFILKCVPPVLASTVVLPEDEVILPPLLNRVRSDLGGHPEGVNVKSVGGPERRAVSGEWFDYGDTLSLPASASFEVIQSEDFAWVGGGVFQGTLGNYKRTGTSLTQYALSMKRGWIRVWIKPGKFDSVVRIEGNGDVFTAKDAEFWLNFKSRATDIYVIRGEVISKVADQRFGSGVYVSLKTGEKTPWARSEGWAASAMEVPIAASYPGFVRLSGEVAKDWEEGKTKEIFGNFRKKGWRKFHRLTPDLKKRQ
jgi:hypothetical protein